MATMPVDSAGASDDVQSIGRGRQTSMSLSVSTPRAVERRMSALNIPALGSMNSTSGELGGWGTFAAAEHKVSVGEFDRMLAGMAAVQQASQTRAPGMGPRIDVEEDARLEKACRQLAACLVDHEIATYAQSKQVLPLLCFALAVLKGASLATATRALRTYAAHDFAVDALVSSYPVQTQLWQTLKANHANAALVKTLLLLLADLTQRTSNGFGFVMSLHFQNNNELFPLLVASLDRANGVDVQIAVLKLVNALLSAARDQKQYEAVLAELNNAPTSSPELGTVASFKQALVAMANEQSPALKDELAVLQGKMSNGFRSSESSEAARKEIASLKQQLQDISALATEYRSATAKLEGELKNFKRREPLVQLLWAEIQQLRGALNVAISGGFAYDLSDPSSRYVKPGHFAYIDRLDVSRWANDGHGQSMLGAPKQAGLAPNRAAPPVPRHTRPIAGMRSGDDAQALAEIADKTPAIRYDIPGPPPAEEEAAPAAPAFTPAVAAALNESTAAAASIPAAPAAPVAPAASGSSEMAPVAPAAPGAPFAPPMAPSAPGAPPMAPGAPSAPGAPGAPMAPGAPARAKGPQPSKPVVKPARKMRALHWQRLLLPVGDTQSMWNQVAKVLPTLEAKVTPKELDEKFADPKQPTDAKKGDDASKDPKKAEAAAQAAALGIAAPVKRENQRFLSDKRFEAIAIMLQFLPPLDKMLAALRNLDLKALNKDQVATLQKQLPSEEEMQLIVASGCRVEELAKPEAFLLQLHTAIPCLNSRVDCWHFINSFGECLDDLRTPFTIIGKAISAVQESKCLPVLCGIVLAAGNYINGSTPRGQADGFDLSVLSRLAMVKDASGDNLLNFVVGKAFELQGEDFGDKFVAELAPCRGAAEFPLRPALAASTRFQGLIKTQKNLAALVIAGTDDSMDPFVSRLASFGRESEQAGADLRALGQQTNDAFSHLLFYLNPTIDATTAAKTQSEELFQTLVDFAELVRQASAQRKAQAEQDRRDKKNAEIRERQKAAKAQAAADKAAQAK